MTLSVLFSVHGGFPGGSQRKRRVLIDMAGWESVEGMKVDNIKPRGPFVVLLVHRVMVPTSEFGSRHWPSVLRDVTFTNQVPNKSKHPDEDVGYGAAVQAAMFNVLVSPQAQNLLLPDTTSQWFRDDRRCHDEAGRTKHHHSFEEGADVHDVHATVLCESC